MDLPYGYSCTGRDCALWHLSMATWYKGHTIESHASHERWMHVMAPPPMSYVFSSTYMLL